MEKGGVVSVFLLREAVETKYFVGMELFEYKRIKTKHPIGRPLVFHMLLFFFAKELKSQMIYIYIYIHIFKLHLNTFVFRSSSGLSNGPNPNLLTIPKQRSSSVTLTYHAGSRRAGDT